MVGNDDAGAGQDQSEPAQAQPVTGVARVESRVLFAGAHELVIRHAGRDYRLRITRNDKLILTA